MKRILLIMLLLIFFTGCNNQDLEEVVINLEYSDETVELTSQFGDTILLPNVPKDDYVFNGWSDGDNLYMGYTVFTETSMTLSPDYTAIDDAFSYVEVINNQAYLGDYVGSSTYVSLPYYWDDYLIVSANSFNFRQDIEKLWFPNSIINRRQSFRQMKNMTEYIFYGDIKGQYFLNGIPQPDFETIMNSTSCDWDGINSFDYEQIQTFGEGCAIIYAKRNNEDAVTVPNLGVFYTFDVLIDLNINHSYLSERVLYLDLPSSIKYLVLPYGMNGENVLDQFFYNNRFENLKMIDAKDDNIYFEDGMLIKDNEEGKTIYYINQDEDTVSIDGEIYTLSRSFQTSKNIDSINIINDDFFESIDGIVYGEHAGGLMLVHVPMNYQEDTLVIDNDVNYVFRIYSPAIEHVIVNNPLIDLQALINYLPNLKSIDISDDHQLYTLEEGVLYNQSNNIIFVNESVDHLEVNDDVGHIYYNAIPYVKSIDINASLSRGIVTALREASQLESISVDTNNPYLKIIENTLYYKETDEAIFIIDGEVEVEYSEPSFDSTDPLYDNEHNIYLSNDGYGNHRIVYILNNPTEFEVPEYIRGITSMAFYYTEQLETLTIHDNIKDLPIQMFQVDTLQTLYLMVDSVIDINPEQTIGLDALIGERMIFINQSSLEHIYVPSELVDDYKTDVFWAQFKDIIEPLE